MPEKNKPLTLDGLDEFDKDEVFTYRGKDWVIPALSQNTAEKLAELAEKIRPAMDNEDFKEILRFDVEYIACAMAEGDNEKIKEIREELRTWKRRTLNRISRFIATTMQGPVDEDIPEEERKKAKN
jgi:DNA-binding GntR family transcriptional regulator